VEGTSRLQWEARALGTVPVALATNPFAEGLDEEGGAVVVGSVEEMAGAIDELLERPDRLRDLSERATRTAREQVDWETYRARVTAALDQGLEEDPAHPARGEMGRVIHELLQRRLEEAREARREVTGLRSRRAVRLALRLANSLRPLRRRYSGGR
jgi:hypothetical protein